MKICDYCELESSGEDECPGCGARSFGSKPASHVFESQPMHYNGYVIWWIENLWHDSAEFLFYLGDRLVERFSLSREVLRMFVPEHCSMMPFIWDVFLVAQGEEEVLRVAEQNTIRPATFEITLKPPAEEEWATGLSYRDVCAAIAIGGVR